MACKIKLPKEGMFVGSGIYPTDTDTLLCTMIGHYTWQAQQFSPVEILDKIVEDNQGNLAQVWGIARGFSPKIHSEWFYALDEIGIDIPAPDWENYRHLTIDEYKSVFDAHQDRYGAGYVRFIREAKKRGIYTTMIYTKSNPEWVPRLVKEGGDFYLGYDFGERYSISVSDAKQIQREIGEVRLGALADRLLARVKEHVDELHRAGWGFIMATSGSFHLDYEVLGGAEMPVVEDFAFPSLNLASALSRGLYRQHDLPMWGSHLAHEHYSWLPNNDPRRWAQLRIGMFLKYMAGSKMIINESGNWFVEHTLAPDSPKFEMPQSARKPLGIIGWGAARKIMNENPAFLKPYLEEAREHFGSLNYDSPVCRKYREIVSDFWNFVKANGTPEGQPETTIALVKGNNDFCSARFNHNYSIGGLGDIAEENPSWYECGPERGWVTANKVFFPLRPFMKPYHNLNLSGTPYGQVDVVSFAKDHITAEFLNRNYKAILFTGWNTCSDKQYDILREYVRNGGILFISIPQLCKNETRNFAFSKEELVNGGDFSELCGVKVTGKGDRFYWATAPLGQDKLFKFPRRYGIIAARLAQVEITDPEIEVLAIDDEQEHPLITLHKYGKGQTICLNSWAYPGDFDQDDGPGGLLDGAGIIGEVYKFAANACRGHVYITDDTEKPGEECDYVAFSYFPEAGKTCILNVDPTQEHTFYLHRFSMYEKITLAPGEFRILDTTKTVC